MNFTIEIILILAKEKRVPILPCSIAGSRTLTIGSALNLLVASHPEMGWGPIFDRQSLIDKGVTCISLSGPKRNTVNYFHANHDKEARLKQTIKDGETLAIWLDRGDEFILAHHPFRVTISNRVIPIPFNPAFRTLRDILQWLKDHGYGEFEYVTLPGMSLDAPIWGRHGHVRDLVPEGARITLYYR